MHFRNDPHWSVTRRDPGNIGIAIAEPFVETVHRGPCAMGCQRHIRQIEQRIGRSRRLSFLGIEPRGENGAVAQRLNQRRLIHHGPSAGVDQDCLRLHALQGVGIDHTARVIVEWHV